ncbi:MAG: S41 family peptidase [Anaeromyxobacteraceae bacterium]
MHLRRLAVAAAIVVAFAAGLSLSHVAAAGKKAPAPPYKPLDVFAEVLASVENNYVEELPEQELVYGAIDGMVAKLDPHSVFMRPDVYRAMHDEAVGEFDGLGLEVSVEGDALVVITPVADSPAERAGLHPGDRVLSIDGEATRDMTLAEALQKMRGAPGTKVVLEIMREGFQAPLKLTLVRDRVRMQSVEWRPLDPAKRLAYVRVKAFQDRTDRAIRKALDDARAAFKGEIEGLVLDLRNNPGGLLQQAVRVSDIWLSQGVIVSVEGRSKANVEIEKAREKDTEPAYPVVILVNKGTASASEIVAGALQDQGRAVLLGATTFGKGSVQSIIELEDGSGLKLTVARYFTPKHRSIHGHGIAPDIAVEVPPPPPPGAREGKVKAGPDVQLERARQWLEDPARRKGAVR